jgi:ribosomal protein S21
MIISGRKVFIKDGNIEKALRKFKKKVAESGVLLEVQERQTYTKPCVQRKIARAMAKKRWKKYLAAQNTVLPK